MKQNENLYMIIYIPEFMLSTCQITCCDLKWVSCLCCIVTYFWGFNMKQFQGSQTPSAHPHPTPLSLAHSLIHSHTNLPYDSTQIFLASGSPSVQSQNMVSCVFFVYSLCSQHNMEHLNEYHSHYTVIAQCVWGSITPGNHQI